MSELVQRELQILFDGKWQAFDVDTIITLGAYPFIGQRGIAKVVIVQRLYNNVTLQRSLTYSWG
jgi:hypothetical protein